MYFRATKLLFLYMLAMPHIFVSGLADEFEFSFFIDLAFSRVTQSFKREARAQWVVAHLVSSPMRLSQ